MVLYCGGSAFKVIRRFGPVLTCMLALFEVIACAKGQGLSDVHPERRGLLASAGFEGQAVKGVYFFPGDRHKDISIYTTHPLDPRDLQWDSDPSTRAWVMDRMVQAHVNTVVMSYWSNMPQWSPMEIGPTTLSGVLDAVQGRPLVIMPAIEGGFDPKNPQIPHFTFSAEFPFNPADRQVAPGLIERIGLLVELFQGRMHLWGRMYDREGNPRFAVNILHASSDVIRQDLSTRADDEEFAKAFDQVAAEVEARFKIPIGFTLDAIGGQSYSALPNQAGAALERTRSVLALHGFASEIFSGLVKNGPPCAEEKNWLECQPHDNNIDNLERLADWKRSSLLDWIATGVPVVLDVNNGFDGRIVWGKGPGGSGYWGDNLDYTEDRWRNWMSQLKGAGIRGITFDTWNGYTEGYAAVPSIEHGSTVLDWLTDLLEPHPSDCSHMHYVNGARTHRVFGAICEKWMALGADRAFGAPVSDELPSARGRVSYFADGKAIYWSAATQAHEVHGAIAKTYRRIRADASCLGLPVSDEQASDIGRVSNFERGRIDWMQGDTDGRVTCQ
jgi:LGFP repeat